MESRPTPTSAVLLGRGASRACPVCGRRRLTSGWFSFPDNCPGCGFLFERHPGHFIGAVGMNTVATFGLLLATLLGGIGVMWPDVRALPLAVATLSVAILFPPLFHPTAKTIWIAIDLMFHPLEPGEAIGDAEEGATKQR